MMDKIFVSAYACEPGLGSEPGVGWHWILEMCRFAELWVMTRASNRPRIEAYLNAHRADHPEYARLHFVWYDLPRWARFWKRGLHGVRTYYVLWEMMSNPLVRRTMRENNISRFMHLTYGNVIWNTSRYGERQQFVWGPVGGLETIPAEFSRHYGRRERLVELVRRLMVATIRLNPGFRLRCRRADLILCKTDITRQHIPAKYRHKAVLQTDVAVEVSPETGDRGGRRPAADGVADQLDQLDQSSSRLELVCVGRMDAWRGFDLAIESVARVRKDLPGVCLTIVGNGSDRPRLEGIVARFGLEDCVKFAGKVETDEYLRLLQEADAVMNPCLKEGAVTVSFDTMALGKPLICVDTTGYTRYFSKEYAEIVPRGSREEVIEGLAQGIRRVADAGERERMGRNAREAGARFTWRHRGEEIRSLLTEEKQHS